MFIIFSSTTLLPPLPPPLPLQTQHSSLHRQSFEELSILLSLKDLLLPQLSDTASFSALILLLSDLFPSCDITGVLAHEEQVREGLTAQAEEDKAGVSARESRAASAMMVVREEHRQPSEGVVTCT